MANDTKTKQTPGKFKHSWHDVGLTASQNKTWAGTSSQHLIINDVTQTKISLLRKHVELLTLIPFYKEHINTNILSNRVSFPSTVQVLVYESSMVGS